MSIQDKDNRNQEFSGSSTISLISISNSTYHYVHPSTYDDRDNINTVYSGASDSIAYQDWSQILSTLAPLKSGDILHIPKKTKRVLDKYISLKDLKEVHPDPDVARELCLIILANLNTTWVGGRWKHLSSEIMNRQTSFKASNATYKKILSILKKGSEKFGPIIEENSYYEYGRKSKMYCMADHYYGKGIEEYKLITEHARKLRNKEYYRMLSDATDNVIAKNLLRVYSELEIPSEEQIIERAKELIASGYKNKKGKILAFQNRHSRSRWKDGDDITFVEENLELYSQLTKDGFVIPTIADENAGGRVSDSFVFMPSWIRNMTQMNGAPMLELDYSALHPNIAMKIYGGRTEYISHTWVAEQTGIPLQDVKVEHLSFFNKRWEDMAKSPLFDFYQNLDPNMMYNIYQDKMDHGHKITSKRMFTEEVGLMTEIIDELNRKGIYVLYIYDALMCQFEHEDIVKETMNRLCHERDIYTTAK